jgi:hypothetical protein
MFNVFFVDVNLRFCPCHHHLLMFNNLGVEIFSEDDSLRLTILTAPELGCTA